ncbi:MAG: DUF21 domain-containing protein [Pirellulaceae bacterium]|nr:DUF21 domain-containing protein [Pirellulaceae bacterium]
MAVLILFSALFSGSEAALFSLTGRGRRRLARSGAGGRAANHLLQDPERLLSAILFWNLLINMTYFAIATIVGSQLESSSGGGRSAALLFTAITLLTIIFFSEMLPKSVAVLVPVRLSVLVGPPLVLAVRLVSPILPFVNTANRLTKRLIWPSFEPEPEIALDDIVRAIDLGTDDAVMQHRDRTAMHGLMEMAEMRAAELMRPRTKLWLTATPVDSEILADGTPPGGYLMLTDAEQKDIVATVGVRLLRPSQMDDLESAAEDVIHVPWSCRISQVWERLDEEDLDVAVVVNEFGEMVGAITVDDILRRVLAPRRGRDEENHEVTSIQEIGTQHYRVDGSTSLRALAKRLEIELPDEAVATVAGYIQRQTERLPRLGDTAILDKFELLVVQQENEVTWIEVTPIVDDSDRSVSEVRE